MWSVLNEGCLFFCYSPKQKEKLSSVIQRLPDDLLGNTTRTALVNLCPTRWVARLDALVAFQDLHLAIAATFEEISTNRAECSGDVTASKAGSLLASVTSFPFIAAFTITSSVLAYTHDLTIKLQRRTEDVVKAGAEIGTVKAEHQKLPEDVVSYHNNWWKEALEMAEKVGVEPSAPWV